MESFGRRVKPLTVFGAASYRRSDGYRHNTDFTNWNTFVRATCDGRAGRLFRLPGRIPDRDFGSNGFYAAYNPDQWEHTATGLAVAPVAEECRTIRPGRLGQLSQEFRPL